MTRAILDSISIADVEAAIASQVVRANWVPMLDATGLVIAYAWKNDEHLAWLTFETECIGRC